MFGYVIADRTSLTQEQLARYQGCYCGLCRCIGQNYGAARRLALNYDLTFLAMLLSSLYEPDEHCLSGRCALHPLSRHASWQTDCTHYAAAMNMILAYHKCQDDWMDERKPTARLQAALFRSSALRAKAAYPRQWQAVARCMETLGQLETSSAEDPDACANAFGDLMAELFVWRSDRWEPLLRTLGGALGRFIYLMDAVLDLPEDLRTGRFNPLRHRTAPEDAISHYRPVLTLYMGECTEAFEQLPLVQDVDVLRNILYSGVWTRYHHHRKEAEHV